MKKSLIKVIALLSVVLIFSSCKKETPWTIKIVADGQVNHIDYFVNKTFIGSTNYKAEFDAKEGDVIEITGYYVTTDPRMCWDFKVFCLNQRRTTGNEANYEAGYGQSIDGLQTVTFTLPH